MPDAPVRYRSPDEDSARWQGFALRPGDVVVGTRSKHGTTWVQTLCLLLVHGTPELPAPLAVLSPWLDWTVTPLEEVVARLDAQPHRRVVKTHTPLDGLPQVTGVTYVVVGRDPLDAAVSLYHQQDNLDRERLRALTGDPGPTGPRPSLTSWVADWVDRDADPVQELDSLPGVLRHLSQAWDRRGDPSVVLLHYDDLRADLEGQLRLLAGRLGTGTPEQGWAPLAAAAGFEAMRARAAVLAPDAAGVLKDPVAFFRRGSSGAAREVLPPALLARCAARVRQLAAPDLVRWLCRGPV